MIIQRLLIKSALTLLTWILLIHALASARGNDDITEYLISNVRIREGDILVMTLSPPVENIQVYAKGEEALLVLTNGSLGAVLGERISIVQVIPGSSTTNLTVTFNSNSTTKMLYGILTNNYTYYKGVSSQYYTFSNGILVILQPQIVIPRGYSKITFILNVVKASSSSGFFVQLPPLMIMLPFVATVMILVYLNAFVIVDSYYISKREELSKARKLGIVILVALSAVIIYWLMNNVVKF